MKSRQRLRGEAQPNIKCLSVELDALCGTWHARIEVLRTGGDESGMARHNLMTCISEIRRIRVAMDNTTKERIINRLHEVAGVCLTCGGRKCGHGSNTRLPDNIRTDTVLRAINLDEGFLKEEAPN